MSKKIKKPVTITIAPEVLRRVDRVAKAQRVSRSAWLEAAALSELDQAELFVKVSQQPELVRSLLSTFSHPGVLRQMVAAMGEEVSDEQMKLFADTLKAIAEGGA